jgi:glycosyltransferase involved in cell wall biosynthesis
MTGDAVDVSILVPAYDEEPTMAAVLDRLAALPLDAEVIVIDDASTDETPNIVRSHPSRARLLRHESNRGKGASIRTGLAVARGRVVVIQDADLEYDPKDLPRVVEPILSGRASVVYGNRFHRGLHPRMAWPNKVINVLLARAVRLLYGQRLHDEATCYKAFRTDLLRSMNLECERFEFCPEVTAKAIRLGHPILEVPISYEPRDTASGRKIRWTDGVAAIWTLLRHRFTRLS